MSKCLAKHIRTNVYFKINIRKRHDYINIPCLEYETRFTIWEFEMMIVLK